MNACNNNHSNDIQATANSPVKFIQVLAEMETYMVICCGDTASVMLQVKKKKQGHKVCKGPNHEDQWHQHNVRTYS